MRLFPRKRRSQGSWKPFQPAVGADFALADCNAIDASNRGTLAITVIAFGGLSVITTGLYGLLTGNFDPLQATWMIAGPFVGAIVAYYFGTRRTDSS